MEPMSDTEAAQATSRTTSFAELALGKLTVHKEPGWVALPYECGMGDLAEAEFTRLAELARRAGDDYLWVVDADLPHTQSAFQVSRYPADPRRLRDVDEDDRFRLADVFFLSPSSSWAVLASELEFSVAVGPAEPVTYFVQNETGTAIDAFRNSLADWYSVPPYLTALAEAPWENYESLTPGTDFIVTWPVA
jgi:hypothetical protein